MLTLFNTRNVTYFFFAICLTSPQLLASDVQPNSLPDIHEINVTRFQDQRSVIVLENQILKTAEPRFESDNIGRSLDEFSKAIVERYQDGSDLLPFSELQREIQNSFYQAPVMLRLIAIEGALETNIDEVKANLAWQISGSVDQGIRQSTNSGGVGSQLIQATKILHDFGTTEAQIASTISSIEAEKVSIRESRADALLNMIESRLALSTANDNAVLVEQFLLTRIQFMQLVKEKFEIGVSSATDVLRAEAKTFEAQAQLPTARQALEDAKNDYIEVFGAEPPNMDPITSPTMTQIESIRLDDILNELSPILIAEHELATAKSAIIAIKSSGKGSLGLKAVAGMSDSPTSTRSGYADLTITYTVDFSDGGAKDAQIRRAEAQAVELKHQLDLIRRQELNKLRASYRSYLSTRDRLRASIDVLIATSKASEATKELFLYNRGTLSDIFKAQDDHLAAARDVVNGWLSVQQAQYQFLRDSNQLLEYFEISI